VVEDGTGTVQAGVDCIAQCCVRARAAAYRYVRVSLHSESDRQRLRRTQQVVEGEYLVVCGQIRRRGSERKSDCQQVCDRQVHFSAPQLLHLLSVHVVSLVSVSPQLAGLQLPEHDQRRSSPNINANCNTRQYHGVRRRVVHWMTAPDGLAARVLCEPDGQRQLDHVAVVARCLQSMITGCHARHDA